MTNRPSGQLIHHYKYVTSQRLLFPGTTAARNNLLLSSTAHEGIKAHNIPISRLMMLPTNALMLKNKNRDLQFLSQEVKS